MFQEPPDSNHEPQTDTSITPTRPTGSPQQRSASLTTSRQASSSLTIAESPKQRTQVIACIEQCFSLCKTYGKTDADMEKTMRAFVVMLGDYPAEKVMKAFRTHVTRSAELPTLADIINLIKRNGKPPLRESDVIAARKKHGEDRALNDWDIIREWEAQQQEGWEGEISTEKQQNLVLENQKLRQQVQHLERQLSQRRLDEVTQKEREAFVASIKKARELPIDKKVENTIAMMRSTGAPEEDIQAFLASIQHQPTTGEMV